MQCAEAYRVQRRRSRGSSCLLDLLFEDENALSLLRGQHGDLFRGELEHLHDQGGLQEGEEKKKQQNQMRTQLLTGRDIGHVQFCNEQI